MNDFSRRDFLQRLFLAGAAGVGASATLAACGGGETSEMPAEEPAEAPMAETFSCMDTSGLTEAEMTARTALHYVDESATEGKNCANCALYVAAAEGALCGACQTVMGPIHPMGNCDIWAAITA